MLHTLPTGPLCVCLLHCKYCKIVGLHLHVLGLDDAFEYSLAVKLSSP